MENKNPKILSRSHLLKLRNSLAPLSMLSLALADGGGASRSTHRSWC